MPEVTAPTSKRLHCLALLLILALALSLRLSALLVWENQVGSEKGLVFGDSTSYWSIAHTITRGETYQFGWKHSRVFRTPGYPVILAGLMSVAGEDCPYWLARLLNSMIGTLTVALVYWLGRELFGSSTGLIAAALAAIYPGAITMSTFILAEAPFCPLMLLNLIAWIRAIRSTQTRQKYSWAIVAGIFAGLAVLVRPSWLLFFPFAMGAGFLFYKSRFEHVKIGTVIFCAFLITMTPWWLRNYQTVGKFVPTSLQTGASLYDGLHENATGGSDMSFFGPERTRFLIAEIGDETELKEWLKKEHAPGYELGNDFEFIVPLVSHSRLADSFEVEFDRHLHNESIAWAKENPSRVIELIFIKSWRMWGIGVGGEVDIPILKWVIALGYVPLVLLGSWGAWKWTRQGFEFALCALPAFYFTGLHVIFVSSIRYRQPAMLALIVLAAPALLTLVAQLRRRSDSPSK